MGITITPNGMHRLLNAAGAQVSQHRVKEEAYQVASNAPNGTYKLVTADETISVTGNAAPPAPTPPAPPPAPTPPAPIPPSPSTAALLASLLNFAQVWKRNWNHNGHNCVVGVGSPPFDGAYGYWERSTTPGTAYEPHLFDRASAGHRLFEMTGDAQWRTQFEDDFAWYAGQIGPDGVFIPKGNGDTKYGYVTPFVLAQAAGILTPTQRAAAARINAGWLADWPSVANLGNAALWTEREMAFSLEAAVGYHRLTGGHPASLARAQALLDQWDAVTAQTGGLGAPRVSYTKHEGGGPGGSAPTEQCSSPWMAALYFQAARQFALAQPSAAAQVNRQVSAYMDYLDLHGFYDAALAHVENTGFVFPRYLTETLIGDAGYDAGNQAHALDVAGLVAHATVAKRALGQSDARALVRLAEMKATAARTMSTAPGAYERTASWLPRYRVNPPRLGNWLIRGMYELVQLGA